MMQLKKATRKQVKLRLNISAPSGAGKTYSALRMANGLCGDWTKVAVIDTENGSASLYSDLGDFNVIDLLPPFTPEKYTEALNACVEAGMEVVIIDSTTHEWACLIEQNELLAQSKYRGNTWSAWSNTTPRHDKFINSILHSPVHVITCTRSKMETIMTDDKKVKKVGMKDVQREGWEYELTISLNIDRDTHLCMASKDRTNLFEGKNPFLITEKTGKEIANWCDSGESELQVAINEMEIVANIEELKNVWSKYKNLQTNKAFITIKDSRKELLSVPEQIESTLEQAEPKAAKLTQKQMEKLLTSDITTIEKYLNVIEEGRLEVTESQNSQLIIYLETLKTETI